MSFQQAFGAGRGSQGRSDVSGNRGASRVGLQANPRYQNANGFQSAGEQIGLGAVNRGGLGAIPEKNAAAAAAPAPAPAGQDPLIKIISDHLLQYQQNVTILQKIVQAIGTEQETDELQDQYRTQLDAVNEHSRRIEVRLKNLEADLDHLSRPEAARRRQAHVKLTKDAKRLRGLQESLAAEAARRLTRMAEERRKIEVASGLDSSGQTEVVDRRERQLMLRAQMQEQKVNQAIIEETEQEMLEINKKLYQINEIYRDLADLVQDQKEQVEHIEVTTEAAHSRAKQGLDQVKKAQESQPVCLIS